MRLHRREWLEPAVAVPLFVALLAACGDPSGPTLEPLVIRDAASGSQAAQPRVVDASTGSNVLLLDGSSSDDGSQDAAQDADDLPVPPPMSCDTDASPADAADGGDANSGPCPLPPSVCVASAPSPNLPTNSVVYYTDGACFSGACTWIAHTVRCEGGCFGGACVLSITAP